MSGDSKSSHVQEQVIAHLRLELQELRTELDLERTRYREKVAERDREVKAAVRQAQALATSHSHSEMKTSELEREVRETRTALLEERRLAKERELEELKAMKEVAWRLTQAVDKAARQEAERDMVKAEVAQLKQAVEGERLAAASLIKEHGEEIKMLREDFRRRTNELYKELHDRDVREQEEIKAIRAEAEKTFKTMEKDFRCVLTEKEEELKLARQDGKEMQRTLETQLRDSFKSAVGKHSAASMDSELVRSYKQEVATLRTQVKRLERQLQAAQDAAMRTADEQSRAFERNLAEKERDGRGDAHRLLQELKRKEEQFVKARNWIQRAKSELGKLRQRSSSLRIEMGQITGPIDDARRKPKPLPPIKSAKVLETQMAAASKGRKLHVKEIVRQLQQKENARLVETKKTPLERCLSDTSHSHSAATSRTIADIQAIDEDLERLRQQIQDRDRIIAHLREISRAKDEKMQQLMTKSSSSSAKHQDCSCLPIEILTRKRSKKDENGTEKCSCAKENQPPKARELEEKQEVDDELAEVRLKESALIAEVALLREREANLASEAAQLREQNDLLEFRILELEECCPSPIERGRWSDDSGGMSLTTSEDLTSASDSDPGDTFGHPSSNENKLTGVATVFSSSLPLREKTSKSLECLQESGIFEESFIKETKTECASSQTDLIFVGETQPGSLNYINFYEERLSQLGEKLAIYESCGVNREKLLNKRLEKELLMANRIRELTKMVDDLEERNQCLEEEKCEFEEAENDSRLQCQLMQHKIHELIGDKMKMEMEMSKKENTMKEMHYNTEEMAAKIGKLEEIQDQLKKKSEEDANMLQALRSHMTERSSESELTESPDCQDKVMLTMLQTHLETSECVEEATSQKTETLTEVIGDHTEPKMEYCEMAAVIVDLRMEVEALKHKSEQDEARIKEMQEGDMKVESLMLTDESEKETGNFEDLKGKIDVLERTNQAFIKALSDADQVWAQMEGDYKKQIDNMKTEHEVVLQKLSHENESLRNKVETLSSKLSAAEEKVARAYDVEVANEALKSQLEIVIDEASAKLNELKEVKEENEGLKRSLEEMKEEVEKEKGKLLEEMEKTLEEKVIVLNEELAKKSREVSDLEVTTSELREEVETLEETFDWQERELAQLHQLTTDLRESMSELETWIVHRNRDRDGGDDTETSATATATSVDTPANSDTNSSYAAPFNLSTLQIALDNLQSKCRAKTEIAKALLGLRSKPSTHLWNIIHRSTRRNAETSTSTLSVEEGSFYPSSLQTTGKEMTFHAPGSRFLVEPSFGFKWREIGRGDTGETADGNRLEGAQGNHGFSVESESERNRHKSNKRSKSRRNKSGDRNRSKNVQAPCACRNSRKDPGDSKETEQPSWTGDISRNGPIMQTGEPKAKSAACKCRGQGDLSRNDPQAPAEDTKANVDQAWPDDLPRNDTQEAKSGLAAGVIGRRPGDRGDAEENCGLHRSPHNAHLGPMFPIVELKKLGYGRLLVAWDNSKLPHNVIGYEISVNGKESLRVNDRDVRKAVLKHLNAAYRLVVSVQPLLSNGSKLEPATAVFPPLV